MIVIKEWIIHSKEVIKLQIRLKEAINNNDFDKVKKIMKEIYKIEIQQIKNYMNSNLADNN